MKSIPEMSIDSRLIYDRLKTAKVGEVIAYEDLSAIIGRCVQGKAYFAMATARNMALKDDRIVFGTVRDIGIKRLEDRELAAISEFSLKKIRKESKRGAQKTLCVTDFDALPNELKTKHNTGLSMLGTISEMTKPSKVKQLEKHVGEMCAVQPMAKTLEFFKTV